MKTSFLKDHKKYLYLSYVMVNLLVALIAPKFFAILLPVTTVLTFILVSNRERTIQAFKHPIFKTTLLIALILFASTPFSISFKRSLIEAIQYSICLLSGGLLLSLTPLNDTYLKSQEQKICIFCYFSCLLILIALTSAVHFRWLEIESHKLNLQVVSFTLLLWPVFLLLRKPSYQKFLPFAAGLTILIIYFSYSETALLMMLAATGVFLFFSFIPLPSWQKTTLLALVIIAISVLPFITLFNDTQAFIKLVQPILGDKAAHLKVWQQTIHSMVSGFPFGSGVSSIGANGITLDLDRTTATPVIISHAHNFIIELIHNLGLIGLLFTCLIFVSFIYLFSNVSTELKPYVGATIVSTIILYSLNYSFWQDWRTSLVFFAFLLILNAKGYDQATNTN